MKNICLSAIVGSRAYGLNHEHSDTDKVGIFIEPTVKIAGLDWNKHRESWTNSSPDGDDLTLHEIGKFLRLTLNGNPTLIELYFMGEYEVLDDIGKDLISLRDHVLSEKTIRDSYHGYAYSQWKEFSRREDAKDKTARHTLRISRQGKSLLENGTFDVKVTNPDEYFDLTNRPKEDIITILKDELDSLFHCKSVLPAEPNKDIVRELLEEVRRNDILKTK